MATEHTEIKSGTSLLSPNTASAVLRWWKSGSSKSKIRKGRKFMKEKYYIAYGSNLNVRQMMERCPLAKIKGVSEIPDYELLFKGSKTGSYLTIEPRKNSKVPVAIWTITEEDEKALDRYEGFPTFYYKKEMKLPVTFLSGETRNIDAFAYIMHENRKIGMPAFYYVETCLEGYQIFGFDQKHLIKALKKSKSQSIGGK